VFKLKLLAIQKILILAETIDLFVRRTRTLRLACWPPNLLEEDSNTYASIVLRLVRRKPTYC